MTTSTLSAPGVMSTHDDPHDVVARDVPEDVSQKVLWALQHAALAPSLDEAQPWVFRWVPELSVVEVYADLRRRPGAPDLGTRELVISCGAAVECFAVALRAAGMSAAVSYGDGDPSDPIATVRFAPAADRADADIELARAVGARRTAHSAFADRLLPATLLRQLADTGREHDAEVRIVQRANGRAFLAPWTQVPDGTEIGESDLLPELAAWSRPIPAFAGGAISSFCRSASGSAAASDSSAVTLAVVSTPGDTRADWVAAGRALASLVLAATAHGVQASYLDPAVNLTKLRSRLVDELGTAATPQVVVRLGHPTESTRPAPSREPLSTVLATTPAQIPRPRSAS